MTPTEPNENDERIAREGDAGEDAGEDVREHHDASEDEGGEDAAGDGA